MGHVNRTEGEIENRLRSLFHFDVEVVVRCALANHEQLFPEERAYIQQAVDRRRAEFAVARVSAREAFRRLNIADCSLVPNKDRSPRWPPGVVGSISHTGDVVAVAVARMSAANGIGIDLESGHLSTSVIEAVCSTPELEQLANIASVSEELLPKIVFSLKEAFYKCQFPLTQRFLDFRDVTVMLEPKDGQVRFKVTGGAEPGWASSRGRFAVMGGLVLAGCWC